jgi:hypothetical protein
MKTIGLTVVLLLARVGLGAEPAPLARLQAKVKVEPVEPTLMHLAGKYANPTKEFSPGLSGNDLYLFPDGTYIYDEWADIRPRTIYDKGMWQIEGGAIFLRSDQDITWTPGLERQFIAVSRRGHPKEILLMGAIEALARFEQTTDDQPDRELMIFAKEKSATILTQSPCLINAFRQGEPCV